MSDVSHVDSSALSRASAGQPNCGTRSPTRLCAAGCRSHQLRAYYHSARSDSPDASPSPVADAFVADAATSGSSFADAAAADAATSGSSVANAAAPGSSGIGNTSRSRSTATGATAIAKSHRSWRTHRQTNARAEPQFGILARAAATWKTSALQGAFIPDSRPPAFLYRCGISHFRRPDSPQPKTREPLVKTPESPILSYSSDPSRERPAPEKSTADSGANTRSDLARTHAGFAAN